mgnify:CR=1 FL=1
MIAKSYEIEKKTSLLLKYNFFLIYGENIGLKKDIKEKIVNEIKKRNSDIEVISFYENEISENEDNFYNTIFSGSLFSSGKIIIINNSTDKILKQIENIEGKKTENISFIFLSNILEKKSKLRNFFEKNLKTLCVACYLDSLRDLTIIASQLFRENKIIASQETISFLAEKCNNDRDNLKNEIEKIKSFTLDKKKIDINEIKSLINFSGEHKADGFINECLCGNVNEYKKILSELYINTVNHIFFLRILSNKIQRLLSIKEIGTDNKNLDSLLTATRPPIFWKDKPLVKRQLTIWSFDKLKEIFNEIKDVELMCKKKPHLSKIIFFNFFTKICKKANSYS